ncbi:hypothetical protein K490DRAFT_67038 [Saccharata proteae CBS 121410]|uniref:SUZ domain-containing protein n=1 Tax=Saccharata proteae CBS 121410 TaxID=1314787 RepID=A0A9P4LU32_9PEZI|nr:hypothetical protein K490DRAFT_67038 [Saccharata proteae CBS 121410]
MSAETPVLSETHSLKPSYSKVVASAYMPHNTEDIAYSSNKTTQNAKSSGPSHKSSDQSEGAKAINLDSHGASLSKAENSSVNQNQVAEAPSKGPDVQVLGSSPESDATQSIRPLAGAIRPGLVDENGSQETSSNSSVKPPSLDGKSVASGTTFATDEKESIRPDDSASIRAVDEEDVFSPPESLAAGSRVSSDNGLGRAFRDQLNEIAIIGPASQRVLVPGRLAQTMNSNDASSAGSNRPGPLPLGSIKEHEGVSQLSQPPDEKLLEALQSPRDRLFVLKLEQDVLDLLKNPKENELNLPHVNAFYRMLAHRFADYYFLGHVVDPVTNVVKITKTTYGRVPPPLSSLPGAQPSGPETPPLIMPARKIMRRGEEGLSGTNTRTNSEGASKTTSEAGGDSGSDAGAKKTLTREEREAKYKEARQRIFGSAEDGDLGDGNKDAEGRDASRSSSAAGKKSKKKARNNDDDGFEARSQFSPFFPGYGPPAYTNDGATLYYGNMASIMPQSNITSTVPQTSAYANGYPVMVQQDAQQQYGWQMQPFAAPNATMGATSYGSAMPANYDINTDFQQRMAFTNGNAAGQTPKMSPAPLATYQDTYRPQSQGVNQAWGQMQNQMAHQTPQSQFNQPAYNDRPMSAGQGMYPYGQLPNPSFTGNSRNQHPLPGSFNRQQFNPQSQTFIPSFGTPMRGNSSMYPMQAPSPQMGNVALNMAPNMMNYGGNGGYAMPMQQHQQQARPSAPVPQSQYHTVRQPSSSVMPKSNGSGQHQLPQPVTAASPGSAHQRAAPAIANSSIAKWGTPSHLPPKPPPPVSMQSAQQQKFSPPNSTGAISNNASRAPGAGGPPSFAQASNGTYPIPSILGSGGARAK